MNLIRSLSLSLFALALLPATRSEAAVTCGVGENLLSWPANNPVWQMCWLPPNQSVGPRGSGMELRNVEYNGFRVLKRAHAPMLFAEYTGNTCYRDWKDTNSNFLAEPQVRNQLGNSSLFQPTTSCDRSSHPTQSYGLCPFQVAGRTSADCFSGVAIEDTGRSLVLTTQYSADWYLYTSRFMFYPDGSFDAQFGFGNRDGTGNGTTHWHHNYWRFDFDIDGSENNLLSINDVPQATEFTSLRSLTGGPGGIERTWEVRNTLSGRGYRLRPSSTDYDTPTNQSGRNFHLVDVIGTAYVANEYTDRGNTNNLGDCAMLSNNLANGADIGGGGAGSDVVLYYRSGVRDLTGVNSMICKSAGPLFTPIGNWQSMFANGFE
ncbi:MAG: hypothetical protein JNL89_14005 [Rhodanobacteraceae bacterium]|nr:hypothetical protein [Rhodanobacteraceae bacterium]